MVRLHALLRRSRAASAALTILLLLVVGLLDLVTGNQVTVIIFFLGPIALASLFLGRAAGLQAAAGSAALSLTAEMWVEARGFEDFWLHAWNAVIRFGLFALAALLLDTLHRTAQRERELSAFKSEMVSLVSHEFSNALAVLVTNLYLLERTEPQPVPERRALLYGAMQRTHEYLLQTVHNFLGRARLESATYEAEVHCLDLVGLARRLVEGLAPAAQDKGLELRLVAPERLVVRGDSAALELVLRNLLSNACKYTPDGGSVTLRLSEPCPGSETAAVSVEDTGIGIPPAQREKILQAFYRAPEGVRAGEGFGLGLNLVVSLLRVMGSTLKISSEVGRGSTFSFDVATCEAEVARTAGLRVPG